MCDVLKFHKSCMRFTFVVIFNVFDVCSTIFNKNFTNHLDEIINNSLY